MDTEQDIDETEGAKLSPMPTELCGVRLELAAPPSLAERWDLHHAMRETKAQTGQVIRVLAAALALGWPRLRRYLGKAGVEFTGDVPRFGAAVIDYLLSTDRKPPAPYRLIVRAGREAYSLSEAGLVTGEDLREAQGFS